MDLTKGQSEKVDVREHKLALTFSLCHIVMMINNGEQMTSTDLN